MSIDKLHLLAKYLLKFEKIDGSDFEKLMKGEITESVLSDQQQETDSQKTEDPQI